MAAKTPKILASPDVDKVINPSVRDHNPVGVNHCVFCQQVGSSIISSSNIGMVMSATKSAGFYSNSA